ncbi:MAG: HDOD domain-containing protein [Candidatus Eisenbacteria bacterium]|uniref:HDOD domain-containing protein n=1 Tax=Eiseniibacteriota bacterium TaxID=2212470 RepID=A0A948RU36_UNCEI|nr:HDOD domain-containing protein [Candidatus Eisenbacteria bacterium]MBU1950004.1 HDOD domain-containing protein [Candidatus Eisenbacteria bacterium]MBU2691038.1 HDOD domain-containing protein [Candidatus Eisenbacteria bacterium]
MSRTDRILNSVSKLPPVPFILTKLMDLMKDPLIESSRLVKIIAMDDGITANILKVSNSPFYGGRSPISNVSDAVTRLGNANIFRIALAASSSRFLGGRQDGYNMRPGFLWKHGLGTGLAAQILAPRMELLDPATAFTSGLLHDMGKLVLSEFMTENYREIRKAVLEEDVTFSEAEHSIIGIDHAELGGLLAERWDFPESLTSVIRWHHHPEGAGEHAKIVAVISLSSALCHYAGGPVGMEVLASHMDRKILRSLSFTMTDVEKNLIALQDQLEQSSDLLGVSLIE